MRDLSSRLKSLEGGGFYGGVIGSGGYSRVATCESVGPRACTLSSYRNSHVDDFFTSDPTEIIKLIFRVPTAFYLFIFLLSRCCDWAVAQDIKECYRIYPFIDLTDYTPSV